MDPAQLIALLTALAAVIGALSGYFAKSAEVRRAAKHDDATTAIDGYGKLTNALQTRLEIVEQKLFQAEKRIGELECENALLREQVGSLKLSIQS